MVYLFWASGFKGIRSHNVDVIPAPKFKLLAPNIKHSHCGIAVFTGCLNHGGGVNIRRRGPIGNESRLKA